MQKDQLNILIIEDELVQAEGLKENLQDLGYDSIAIASTYAEVQRLVAEKPFDLVLADINLGEKEMPGTTIVSQLKLAADAIVIYLSSYDDAEYRDKAVASGATSFLTKVVSKKQLDVAIDFAMKKRFQDRQKTNGHEVHCPLFSGKTHLFIKIKDRFVKLRVNDLLYLQADTAYCFVVTADKRHHISTSMNHFLQQANLPDLVRCHRSYAVNVNHVESFDDQELFVACNDLVDRVPMGGTYKAEVMSRLFKIKAE